MATVLVLDAKDGDTLRTLLGAEGHSVHLVDNIDEAFVGLKTVSPELVIVDHAPSRNAGWLLLAKLDGVPAIVLSAQDSITDRVTSLRLGADDFVSKPFDKQEFLERVNAVLRRSVPRTEVIGAAVTVGDLTIDPARASVRVGPTETVHLTPIEFHILLYLARRVNATVSDEEIGTAVWGYTVGVTHTVYVNIGRIRKKLLGANLGNPTIETVRNVGYCLALKSPSGGTPS